MTHDPRTPWSDPDHDVGADLVQTLATRVYDHLSIDAAAAAAAEWLNRGIFRIGAESVAEAIRFLSTAAAAAHRDIADHLGHHHVQLTKFTDTVRPAQPAWKRVERRTWHGGPINHTDLDIDVGHVADQVVRAVNERAHEALDYQGWHLRELGHLRTGPGQGFPGPVDYPNQTVRYFWPKGAGKTARLAQDIKAWAQQFERVNGNPPTVVEVSRPAEVMILDETRGYLDYQRTMELLELDQERDFEQAARRYFLNQYRPEEPAQQPARAWRGWTQMGATYDDEIPPPRPARRRGPADFFWWDDAGEPQHHHVD